MMDHGGKLQKRQHEKYNHSLNLNAIVFKPTSATGEAPANTAVEGALGADIVK